MRILAGFLLLTLYGVSFEYHLDPYLVTDGVSCFFGLYGDANQRNGGRVVNTCYVESSDGYVVIDSGPTYQYAKQAYLAMQKIKKLPVKYVINTTVKDIHVLGNAFYKEKGAKLIGPESYYELFTQDSSSCLSSKISKEAFESTRLVPLDSYLKNDRELILGDTKIEIKRFDKKEGRHLVVNFPKKKIIFVGDYISNGQAPTLDKCHTLANWKHTLNTIKSLPWKYIISSHGTKRVRTALRDTQKYLNYLAQKQEKNLRKKNKNHRNSSNMEMFATQHLLDKKLTDKIIKKVPNIYYTNFKIAKREAIKENKYIMIKVEVSNCKPCIALNKELANNRHIKEMVNKHIKAVEINTDYDYDSIPMGLTYMGTPTVFLIEPKSDRVLMQLEGTLAAKEIENSLDMFIDDSFKKGVASL